MGADRMSEHDIVDIETCEVEFERFLDAMDIDADKSHMDESDRAGFDRCKATIVREMRAGRLVIDDKGQPKYTPKSGDGETLVFHEPTGATYLEMDRKKQGHDVSKMIAIMGAMTKQAPAVFSKMPQRDFKVCQAVVTLFLG